MQSASLIGTWSHDLARAWVVIELMGQAGALGAVLLCTAIPSWLFILQGGVLIDRVNIRRAMMVGKAILAITSLSLAFIIEFGTIEMWMFLFICPHRGLGFGL